MHKPDNQGVGYALGVGITAVIMPWPVAWCARFIESGVWWAGPAWFSLIFGALIVSFLMFAIIGGLLEENIYGKRSS